MYEVEKSVIDPNDSSIVSPLNLELVNRIANVNRCFRWEPNEPEVVSPHKGCPATRNAQHIAWPGMHYFTLQQKSTTCELPSYIDTVL